jgi:hypothetical protein
MMHSLAHLQHHWLELQQHGCHQVSLLLLLPVRLRCRCWRRLRVLC